MRLSYHGWAATLLVLSFALVVGGIALGVTPGSVDSPLSNGNLVSVTCGSPWAPRAPIGQECTAALAARGDFGLVLVVLGVVLFLGMLVAGMIVAGVRDALTGAQQVPSPAPPAGEPTAS